MALPIEIANFFALLRDIWGTFPLMARQCFYLAIAVVVVLGIFRMVRS